MRQVVNKYLVSIIVPVYKVEQYLSKCIESILSQTYKNFELILVDDGSPDDCPQICDKYAEKDSRIKVIHQENKGVSCARNAGIDCSKGQWLMFVDADDWLENDMLEYLLSGDLSCDIIACSLKICSQDKEYFYKSSKLKYRIYDLQSKKDLRILLRFGDALEFCVSYAKIYRRQCIIHNHIYFPKGVVVSEDRIFNIEVFKVINQLQVLPEKKYYYRSHEASVCRNSSFDDQRYYLKYCIDKNWDHVLDCDMFCMMYSVVVQILKDLNLTYFQKKNEIKNIFKERLFNDILNSVSILHINNFKLGIACVLLKCRFYFGLCFLHLIKYFLKKIKQRLEELF